ncbi:MAG: hypothetical protein GC189_13400 [Alphaproteobacteria bacterium]|nr:hypothetical protein [Alphaproteobacteria bacterium]
MRMDDQRRSTNIEDRRGMRGGGGGGFGGGLPVRMRGMGLIGIIILGLVLLFAPAGIRNMIIGQLTGGGGGASSSAVSTQQAGTQGCPQGDQACDFVSAVLGSTEDVWNSHFSSGNLPGGVRGAYEQPTLVLFEGQVATACGNATSAVGPFYCPGDAKLYIDLSFYETLARRLRAPGDFAQAYVIAHEVGHHVQNMIGATRYVDQARGTREQNPMSVRLELQADCLAGVWGHDANRGGQLEAGDLDEALTAAHAIGDDTLQRGSQGYVTPASFTHGTSEQRQRWFRRGYDSGDATQCDTFAVRDYNQL